jgi:hypothetical protein
VRTTTNGDKIDHKVLQERSVMLTRELEELSASITANANRVSSLRRMLEVRDLLKVVSRGGHSILSWAAGCGDEEIVKLLLKRGAHSILGSIQEYSASIIQIAYRNKRSAKSWKQNPVVSFRIKSLNNLARHELKNLRLPLAEALCSGHSNIARVLDTSDLSNSQAVELFPLFCPPQGLSRSLIDNNKIVNIESSCELLTSIIKADQLTEVCKQPCR